MRAGSAQRSGSSSSERTVTADVGPSTGGRHQACRLAESVAAVSIVVDPGYSPREEFPDALVVPDWEQEVQAVNSSLSAGRRSREDIDVGSGPDS